MLAKKRLNKHVSPCLILVAYVQEVELSARQYPRQPAISSHMYSLFQYFSPLLIFVLFASHVHSCMHLWIVVLLLLRECSSCLSKSVCRSCSFFNWFFLCSYSAVVMARSLNLTSDTHSIECVGVFMCGCMGLCSYVYIWLHVCISVLFSPFFLKRFAGVFEAHGSSCCVPSYFPASVSTWLCAGCSPSTPPQPENQPGRPAPSGCSACS